MRYRKKILTILLLDRDNKFNLTNVDFNCDNYCILICCNHFESVIGTQGQPIKKKLEPGTNSTHM